MAHPPDSSKPARKATSVERPVVELDADVVIAFLRQNPDFLIQHPEAILAVMPPDRAVDSGVVDLQKAMLDRLRSEVARLKATQKKLIATSRVNMQNQGRVHTAVLALMGVYGLDQWIQVVTTDLPTILDLDSIVVGFEPKALDAIGDDTGGLIRLPQGAIDRLLGGGKDIRLRADADGERIVFGPAATLIRSDALVRLRLGDNEPQGLAAFGSRRANTFHPSQGTELLNFLVRAVASALRGCLAHPG
jgi:uncharacterized protein YigA (DUF484 family)